MAAPLIATGLDGYCVRCDRDAIGLDAENEPVCGMCSLEIESGREEEPRGSACSAACGSCGACT